MSRRTFGRRINEWLDEPDNEQFTDGKWRFWLPAVFGFSILNAVLTVLIFRETASANYLTPALLAASAIVGWIAIGCLHYSDAKRGRMARGVSALDSASLLFVIGHFCFLVYILGHGWILRGAEADYKIAVAAYDERAGKVSEDNRAIADAATKIAELETKRARLENDAAYQLRKAAERGAKVQTAPRSGSAAAGLATSKVELAPPPKPPDDTQAAFLARWDAWVRITNFGELILAAITLIFIRNWTAKANAPAESSPLFGSGVRASALQPRFDGEASHAPNFASPDSGEASPDGLRELQEVCSLISYRHPGRWYAVDLRGDHVRVRLRTRRDGREVTLKTARLTLEVLSDVLTMDREAFTMRLERLLKKLGFEI